MKSLKAKRVDRRALLKGGAAVAGLAGAGFYPRIGYTQAKTTTVNMQLGWLANNNQVGELAAKYKGYFEEEGINLVVQPGGPTIDGVAIVASGRYEIGQVSSSPSLMLAASQKLPVKCFGVGAQKHPYAYFTLPNKPVRKAEDLVGKKVGVQSTAKILLSALLKKHNIPESSLEVVIIGSEMTPVLTGQTDVVSGWISNTTTLKPLGPERIDLMLWDAGVRLYALPYYATHDTIERKPELLAGFMRAASKGWVFANQNPEAAIDMLMKDYTNLVRDDELEGTKALLPFCFGDRTKTEGWGTFDKAVWEDQINLYDSLQQFTAGRPKLEDVITTTIIDATKDKRAKA